MSQAQDIDAVPSQLNEMYNSQETSVSYYNSQETSVSSYSPTSTPESHDSEVLKQSAS